MKSFWQLLRQPQFAIALAFAFMLAGWDLAYGSKIVGGVMVVLLMGTILLNVIRTKKK